MGKKFSGLVSHSIFLRRQAVDGPAGAAVAGPAIPVGDVGLGLYENNACSKKAECSYREVHTHPRPKHGRLLATKAENATWVSENDALTNTKGGVDQGHQSGHD
jgi:hypothetical protein